MTNRIEQLMYEIFKLKKAVTLNEAAVEHFKQDIDNDNTQIEKLSLELLNELTINGTSTYDWKSENLVAQKFVRDNVGYTSEAEVLNYLKNSYDGQCVKVKVTESLDKNALKKALKNDMKLSEALDSMTVKTITEYVVVTDSENHKKMLEHISEQKS